MQTHQNLHVSLRREGTRLSHGWAHVSHCPHVVRKRQNNGRYLQQPVHRRCNIIWKKKKIYIYIRSRARYHTLSAVIYIYIFFFFSSRRPHPRRLLLPSFFAPESGSPPRCCSRKKNVLPDTDRSKILRYNRGLLLSFVHPRAIFLSKWNLIKGQIWPGDLRTSGLSFTLFFIFSYFLV